MQILTAAFCAHELYKKKSGIFFSSALGSHTRLQTHINYISHCQFFSSPFLGYWIHLYHATVNIFILYFYPTCVCTRKGSTDTLSLSIYLSVLDILHAFLRRSSQYNINTGDSYYPFGRNVDIRGCGLQ